MIKICFLRILLNVPIHVHLPFLHVRPWSLANHRRQSILFSYYFITWLTLDKGAIFISRYKLALICQFSVCRIFVFKMPHLDHSVRLDFKDVLIRPKRSTIRSRADVSMILIEYCTCTVFCTFQEGPPKDPSRQSTPGTDFLMNYCRSRFITTQKCFPVVFLFLADALGKFRCTHLC